jgi:spore germination protein GerM
VAVRKGTKTRVPAKSASGKGAQKKKSSSGKKKTPWAVLFWLAFIIFLLGLYFINREAINNSIQIIQREVFSRNVPEEPVTEAPVEPDVIQVPPPAQGVAGQPAAVAPPVEPVPSETVSSQPPATTPSQAEPQNVQPQAPQVTQTGQGTAELRDRALYFTQIGSDGSVQRVRSDRRLPATDSPLRDVIQALIAGPNAEERQRGLISLIPGGTRLLSIAIRGDTAYINFNEDFQYNTYGTQGYNGQLRQIVFTATEFPNVRDVQILIEGNRVDYIGESIWIGSPLNRDMF